MNRAIKLFVLIAVIGFSFAACDNGNDPGPINQTPIASDYILGNMSQTAGSVVAVTITPNSGKSLGAVGNIRYNVSTAIPQTAGTYVVIFDVAATTGWNAATGLYAGNLTVTGGGTTEPPDMVLIQLGTFTMGSPETEPNRDSGEIPHLVTLSSFSIGKYPVTQAQYQAVMGNNPSNFKTSSGGDNPANRPVEMVSWYDAIVFCNKLSILESLSPAYRINGSTDPAVWGTIPTSSNVTWNAVQIVAGSNGYRLPTEAQWEYACRAGTITALNWGTDINSTQANYDASNVDAYNTTAGTSLSRTTEVESYEPNQWGLYDMHGNVLEWCWDWHGNYSSGTQADPTGAASGFARVLRGGSWGSSGQYLRSAYRTYDTPGSRLSKIGFRLVRPAQ